MAGATTLRTKPAPIALSAATLERVAALALCLLAAWAVNRRLLQPGVFSDDAFVHQRLTLRDGAARLPVTLAAAERDAVWRTGGRELALAIEADGHVRLTERAVAPVAVPRVAPAVHEPVT